jgi:hypothetical protein
VLNVQSLAIFTLSSLLVYFAACFFFFRSSRTNTIASIASIEPVSAITYSIEKSVLTGLGVAVGEAVGEDDGVGEAVDIGDGVGEAVGFGVGVEVADGGFVGAGVAVGAAVGVGLVWELRLELVRVMELEL